MHMNKISECYLTCTGCPKNWSKFPRRFSSYIFVSYDVKTKYIALSFKRTYDNLGEVPKRSNSIFFVKFFQNYVGLSLIENGNSFF